MGIPSYPTSKLWTLLGKDVITGAEATIWDQEESSLRTKANIMRMSVQENRNNLIS